MICAVHMLSLSLLAYRAITASSDLLQAQSHRQGGCLASQIVPYSFILYH